MSEAQTLVFTLDGIEKMKAALEDIQSSVADINKAAEPLKTRLSFSPSTKKVEVTIWERHISWDKEKNHAIFHPMVRCNTIIVDVPEDTIEMYVEIDEIEDLHDVN